MTKYAKVDDERIHEILEIEDGLRLLPVVEKDDEAGTDQLLGSPDIKIEGDHVLVHRKAVRALSGKVAILNEKGDIVETRDLGPVPVQVKDNVVSYTETLPPFDRVTHVIDSFTLVRGEGTIEKVWKIRALTTKELEAAAANDIEQALQSKFGARGLELAFSQENRLLKIEGKPPLTLDQFKAQEADKLSDV